jgi:hypothetical protein
MMLMLQKPTLDLQARFERLLEVDWDFPTSGSLSSFSNLHWHPSRYPSQVPAIAIGALTSPGEVVLDPFVGSGTTAIEAQRLSRRCIGIELNPVAALMARAKTINRPFSRIKRAITQLRLQLGQSNKRGVVPETVQAEKWYTERTLNDLRRLKYCVDSLKGIERLIADTAFSAILLPVCRETRHWGYVCDNTMPKGHYERDVLETFDRTLESFLAAYADRDSYWSLDQKLDAEMRSVDIIQGDARAIVRDLTDGVDLIVTSPPYFGVADYVKAQRLSMEWRGEAIEPVRRQEIGARSKRHRLTAEEEYLQECRDVFSECRRVLHKGRACVIIFGESSDRNPIYSRFVSAIESSGFKLVHSVPRKISARRRLNPRLHLEHILLFV